MYRDDLRALQECICCNPNPLVISVARWVIVKYANLANKIMLDYAKFLTDYARIMLGNLMAFFKFRAFHTIILMTHHTAQLTAYA